MDDRTGLTSEVEGAEGVQGQGDKFWGFRGSGLEINTVRSE